MPRSPAFWAVAALLIAAPACETGRRSPAGFRLPPDGDIERGKAAFVGLGCTQCHDAAGVSLPKAQARTAHPIVLGGEVTREPSDGRLVKAVIWPSPNAREGQTMPHFEDQMTVRQLTDTVAFLQSRYTLRKPAPTLTGY
jgi:L-cysteine S-thiosulfotransferase